MTLHRTGKANPVSLVALVLVMGGVAAMIRPALFDRNRDAGADVDCVLDATGNCVRGLPDATRLYPNAPGPVLAAEEACVDVGYLCADLANEDRIVIMRWRDFSGTIVVHVPLPPMQDGARARNLQRAAAAGVRLWNGQPFPILVDERGTREAHFAVQWVSGMGGSQIGLARTRWSPASGLEVVSLELSMYTPYGSTAMDTRQLRLTAMHEMGHALGLPHSDSPRDVMYPTNTATALSSQDYITMAALYAMEDGTEIVR